MTCEFVLVRLYDNGLVSMGCNGGLERCLEVVELEGGFE